MHPTIDLELIELPVYSAIVMAGIFAGVFTAYLFLHARLRRAMNGHIFLDGALLVCVAGWIGARAYHVATNWDYYVVRPEEIAQVGLGGLAMRGALLTGFIALFIYARIRALRRATLFDATAFGLAIGQALGWTGALAHGANYGVLDDSALAMDLPDSYGLIAPRFPVQYFEIALFGSVFVGLLITAVRKPHAGVLFGVYLLTVSWGNFLLGFQRGDAAVFVNGLRMDQWADTIMGLIALVLLFCLLRQRGGNVGINQ